MSTAPIARHVPAPVPGRIPSPRAATIRHRRPEGRPLKRLLWIHRRRLALTYALFNLENGLDLLQPWLFGLAISGVLEGRLGPLLAFVGFCVVRTGMGIGRNMYDTRTFMGVYSALAAQLVIGQRREGVPASRIAARVSLSRELTDFLERDIPIVFSTLYAVAGSIVMLAVFDLFLAPIAVLLGLAGACLNLRFARRTARLNAELNDIYERDVDVITGTSSEATEQHYARTARCQVRLSDWQALASATTQTVIIALLLIALLRIPAWNSRGLGDIFAVFRYVLLFTGGLGSVPLLISRGARLRDILARAEAHLMPAAPES